MNAVDTLLAQRSQATILVLAIALVAAIGTIELLAPPDASLAVLYLLPVLLATWYTGFGAGALIAIASALAWMTTEAYHGVAQVQAFIPYWNTATRLVFFLIAAYLLTRLKHAPSTGAGSSGVDPLTNVSSAERFYSNAKHELHRANRYDHPFTAVYVDIVQLQSFNDTFGRNIGDRLLREVASTLAESLRKPDIAARLGGDEFMLLLPETDAASAAQILPRLQEALATAMQRHGWPVNFSIAATTYASPPPSVHDIVRRADRLLYSVQAAGGGINHETYRGSTGSLRGPAARRR